MMKHEHSWAGCSSSRTFHQRIRDVHSSCSTASRQRGSTGIVSRQTILHISTFLSAAFPLRKTATHAPCALQRFL